MTNHPRPALFRAARLAGCVLAAMLSTPVLAQTPDTDDISAAEAAEIFGELLTQLDQFAANAGIRGADFSAPLRLLFPAAFPQVPDDGRFDLRYRSDVDIWNGAVEADPGGRRIVTGEECAQSGQLVAFRRTRQAGFAGSRCSTIRSSGDAWILSYRSVVEGPDRRTWLDYDISVDVSNGPDQALITLDTVLEANIRVADTYTDLLIETLPTAVVDRAWTAGE